MGKVWRTMWNQQQVDVLEPFHENIKNIYGITFAFILVVTIVE